ncbi:hypothetical protein WJX73_007760 [Symbiochloris irregularis]|uniref:Uncharacterized protein n=1 Tax=Symbiochloris irregularis TaxID=706552 RepID=A0AAW1PZW4_9CHLO
MLRNLKSLLWRFLLLAACIDVVTFTLLSSGLSQRTLTAQALFRSRQLTVRFLRGIDPYLEGRREDSDPAPRCCSGEGCLTDKPGRHAVITALRSDSYLPLLKALVCTLGKSNPGLPLVVLTSPGDLQQSSTDYIQSVASLHLVSSIDVSKRHYKEDGRYALNWIKLAAWNLTEWQALLWIDSDATVDGNVASVFSLPTDFAATLDQGRTTMRYSAFGKLQAGVFMLRPCKAVARHMETLVLSDTRLQFRYGHAEQDFLDWYFNMMTGLVPVMMAPHAAWPQREPGITVLDKH